MDAAIQGRVQGAVSATMALAQVLGPLAVGWLYLAVAPAAPYWVIATQITVAIALMMFAVARIPAISGSGTTTSVANDE